MSRTAPLVLAALLLVGVTACAGTEEPTIADVGGTPEAATSAPGAEATEVGGDAADPEPTASAGEGGAPTYEEACAGREDDAFIEVLTPRPDAEVGDPFTVTGCGNTFEANYEYRVVGPDGSVLTDGFGTMSCGTGCVGEFTQQVTVGTTGPVTLVVFNTSAADGSEEHVVEVPLTIS